MMLRSTALKELQVIATNVIWHTVVSKCRTLDQPCLAILRADAALFSTAYSTVHELCSWHKLEISTRTALMPLEWLNTLISLYGISWPPGHSLSESHRLSHKAACTF